MLQILPQILCQKELREISVAFLQESCSNLIHTASDGFEFSAWNILSSQNSTVAKPHSK